MGDPFEWDSKERAELQAELDAIYAYLYSVNKEDLSYILDTFDVLRNKEISEFNEYRTKNLILKAFQKISKQNNLFK